MDYEKKYKEAMKACKELSDTFDNETLTEELEKIFPELAESEDERVMRELIDFFGGTLNGEDVELPSKDTMERWVAWIEKQGEQNQKHFELKAGHWYICHRAFCCRADHLTVKEGERFMCEKDGIVKGFVIKEPEKYFKEVCAPAPIEDERKPANKVEPKFKIGQIIKKEGFNLGFTIVKIEDGFYYNDEGDYFPFTDQDNWELVEQSPAWSEEDETGLTNTIIMLKEGASLHFIKKDITKAVDWLKSLKDRYTWKPSDKQIEAVRIAAEIGTANDSWAMHVLEELYTELKKLKG